MTRPEPHLPKRRLQILDDETRDGHGFYAREDADNRAHEDNWVGNLVARLAALIRRIGGNN